MSQRQKYDVEQELINFIASQLKRSPNEITAESMIVDLSNDSIQLFELLLAFERAYSMHLSYDEVVNLRTVDDVANLILKSSQ